MPTKNILVQVGEHTVTKKRIVPVYNDYGDQIGEKTETYEVTVPTMEAQNVEMTPEEVAEMEEMARNMPEPEPTMDERLEDIEQALIDIAAVQAEQDEIQAQQEDALIELAALTEE